MTPNSPSPQQNATIEAHFQHRPKGQTQRDFTLSVEASLPAQGVTAIFGPSGSGKTTFLRCMAGLEKAEYGVLSIAGQVWQNEGFFLPTHKRPLGYVFQEASLFPHLTAQKNLNYAIKRAHTAPSQERINEVIDIMGIAPLLKQFPNQLSGGERQRVAIARALLIQPDILLMDEPLASLDTARKREIMPYLQRLRTYLNIPILYVSHSIEEVAQLASHVLVLDNGRLMESGTPEQVFGQHDLGSTSPLHNIESTVIWQGQVVERDAQWHLAKVACAGGELWLRDTGTALNSSVGVAIEANQVSLTRHAHTESSVLNQLSVTVLELVPDSDPAFVLVRLHAQHVPLIARITQRSAAHLKLAVGGAFWAHIKSAAITQ